MTVCRLVLLRSSVIGREEDGPWESEYVESEIGMEEMAMEVKRRLR